VKYSDPGGSITMTARTGEMFVRIDIADTGIGIEESEWAAVFRRFYRSPRTARYEGVGLGLYVTRQILTAQGGYIKVSSVPGEGSVFSVFLPVECGR
ncbi:sensor histidine kinase, partial [Clostridium perfringens]